MTRTSQSSKIISILIVILVVFGYLLFRLVLNESSQPITYELFAALIGFGLTVLATSFLLNRQTEAELAKEENILFLNLKMNVYRELLDQIQDVIMKREILEEDILELRLLNQKITFVGSRAVLMAFNRFVRYFSQIAKVGKIDPGHIDDLLDHLSELSVHIREDLFNRDRQAISSDQVKRLILSSNEQLDME